VEWLIGTPDEYLPTVPFKATGGFGFGTIVSFRNTSAANAAQTISLASLANGIDGVRIHAAEFETSGGTATGEFRFATGQIISSTAAVATFAFNVGAKGEQPTIGYAIASSTAAFEVAIGAAGIGFTSTVLVTYEVIIL
jgi:hypothetical protein